MANRVLKIRCILGLSLVLAAGSLMPIAALAEAPPAVPTAAPAPAAATPPDPANEAHRKQVLAKVGSAEITVGRIEDQIAGQSPVIRARYGDPAELQKLLDSSVRFELLAQEAQKRGYDKNASVVRTVKESTVQNLMRTEIDEAITPQSVPAAEVKAYYDSHADEFHRAAVRRASHVLYDTEKEAKAALAQAAKLDQRGFSELAKKDSKDTETKLRGGDLGYFTKEPSKDPADPTVHPALRKAVFELKTVGDTHSKPVLIDKVYSIVRLTGERPERHTDLAEAEPAIRTRLWREKRQEAMTKLVEKLRTTEKPETFPERVDLVKLDDMDKGPGGFAPEPAPKATKPKKGGE